MSLFAGLAYVEIRVNHCAHGGPAMRSALLDADVRIAYRNPGQAALRTSKLKSSEIGSLAEASQTAGDTRREKQGDNDGDWKKDGRVSVQEEITT